MTIPLPRKAIALALAVLVPAAALAEGSLARRRSRRSRARSEASVRVSQEPVQMIAAQDPTGDIAMVARELEGRLTRGTSWGDLVRDYPAEVVVPALGRVLASGPAMAQREAARLLGEAPGTIPLLILLDMYGRSPSPSTRAQVGKVLARWSGCDAAHPVSETKLIALLERIGRDKPAGVAEYLIPMLNTYRNVRVHTLRALAEIGATEAVEAVRSLLGGSDEVDAQAVGTLALLGEDSGVNRDRLARALVRAVNAGECAEPAARSILRSLRELAVQKKDSMAVPPMVAVVPHADEPYRTLAMATLYRVSVEAPEVFAAGLGHVQPDERTEFINDMVAYLYQKDLAHSFLERWHEAFRMLDLAFGHYDVVEEVTYLVRKRLP